MVRVRFAPSPTGHFHIGGVRTALFNYLYAKNQRGRFLVRIEDTDRERSREEFEEEILSGLKWLGLDWDEDIFRQSHREKKYKKALEKLLEAGLAYKDPKGTEAVYFKVSKKSIKFFDIVREPIVFDTNLFDDFVIMKADGSPAFHFACVVDDIDMKITHVIRGDDHLTNTARQLLIYEALEEKPPKFAHLPLILNESGKPLSKREGGGSLGFYIEQGFLPEGLLNYLVLLGWGPGGNEEFFTKRHLIKKFSLKRVNKTAAALNFDKLKHINNLHMKKMSRKEYQSQAEMFYRREVEDSFTIPKKNFLKCALVYKDRLRNFNELLTDGKYYFEDFIERDEESVKKYFNDSIREKIESYTENLKAVNFTVTSGLEKNLREQAAKLEVKAGELIHAVRVALTGKTVSPGIFDVMKLVGKKKTIRRLQEVLEAQKEGAHGGK